MTQYVALDLGFAWIWVPDLFLFCLDPGSGSVFDLPGSGIRVQIQADPHH